MHITIANTTALCDVVIHIVQKRVSKQRAALIKSPYLVTSFSMTFRKCTPHNLTVFIVAEMLLLLTFPQAYQ